VFVATQRYKKFESYATSPEVPLDEEVPGIVPRTRVARTATFAAEFPSRFESETTRVFPSEPSTTTRRELPTSELLTGSAEILTAVFATGQNFLVDVRYSARTVRCVCHTTCNEALIANTASTSTENWSQCCARTNTCRTTGRICNGNK
jgi:hypothetical protein